jgi:succinate dehydrogenase/fumarate reductase cytochrome b subunit
VSQPSVRVFLVLAALALAHHLLAGIRHLLFDLHVATAPPHRPEHLRPQAIRATAWAVLVAEAIAVIVTIVALV